MIQISTSNSFMYCGFSHAGISLNLGVLKYKPFRQLIEINRICKTCHKEEEIRRIPHIHHPFPAAMLSRCSLMKTHNYSIPNEHDMKARVTRHKMNMSQNSNNMLEVSAVVVDGSKTFEIQNQCHRSSLPILLTV